MATIPAKRKRSLLRKTQRLFPQTRRKNNYPVLRTIRSHNWTPNSAMPDLAAKRRAWISCQTTSDLFLHKTSLQQSALTQQCCHCLVHQQIGQGLGDFV